MRRVGLEFPSVRLLGFEACSLFGALSNEPIRDVVLVDVAHVLNRFAADALGRDPFDVAEPYVRVQAAGGGLATELTHSTGPGVVGRERQQCLVQVVNRLIFEVFVHHEPDVFDAGVNVWLQSGDVADLQLLSRVLRDLHHIDGTHAAPCGLIEAGFDLERLRQDDIRVSSPLGYLDFLALEAKAAAVLTDSGGVQEETSALGVRCFTLRDTTERPITVEYGTNTVLGVDPRQVARIPNILDEEGKSAVREIPLWDGQAGQRAARVIAEFLQPPLTSGHGKRRASA